MAVDFGDARTGLAVCDRTEFLASPIGTIEERNPQILAMKVAHMAEQYEARIIVVGLPKNMDGSEGARAEKCRRFADTVAAVTEAEVVMWDERSTTVSAHRILDENNVHGKQRKNVVDTVAAVVILESYLEYRKKQSSRS